MRCARKPTSVKQPKWHSLSTSSTACWRWDARATSASYETTRTPDHCVHRLIHATRSVGAAIANAVGYRIIALHLPCAVSRPIVRALNAKSRLLVEPDVLEAPAVEDAVDHHP